MAGDKLRLKEKAGWRVNSVSLAHCLDRHPRLKDVENRAAVLERMMSGKVKARAIRNVLNAAPDATFQLSTLDAIAQAIGASLSEIADIENKSAYALLAEACQPSTALDYFALIGILEMLNERFRPLIERVYPHVIPADAGHPKRITFGGTPSNRGVGYAEVIVDFKAPVLDAIVSYSLVKVPLTVWIDYGHVHADDTRTPGFRRSFPYWLPSNGPQEKQCGEPRRLRFLTWYDAFPNEFMIRTSDPMATVVVRPLVEREVGDRVLADSSVPTIGFPPTFHEREQAPPTS